MKVSEWDRLQKTLEYNLPRLLDGEINKIEKESGGWNLIGSRIKDGANPPMIRIDIQLKVEKGDQDES